jgi:hypothetical protein
MRSDNGRVSGFPYIASIICSRLFAFVCRWVNSETVKGRWSLCCLVMGNMDWTWVRMSQWSPLSAAMQVGERSTWSMREAPGLDREENLVMVD